MKHFLILGFAALLVAGCATTAEEVEPVPEEPVAECFDKDTGDFVVCPE